MLRNDRMNGSEVIRYESASRVTEAAPMGQGGRQMMGFAHSCNGHGGGTGARVERTEGRELGFYEEGK